MNEELESPVYVLDGQELAPQVWHQYEMPLPISIAWIGLSLTTAHHLALEDAWDLLVVDEEWRKWVDQNMATYPFIYLTLRDGIGKRGLRKTPSGVSMNVPAEEVYEADRAGNLIPLYLDIIWTIFDKWAKVSGCSSPPLLSDELEARS